MPPGSCPHLPGVNARTRRLGRCRRRELSNAERAAHDGFSACFDLRRLPCLLPRLPAQPAQPAGGARTGARPLPRPRRRPLRQPADAEIRSVFRPNELITPDDVRQRGLTLRQSMLRRGWPTLRRARGQVVFLMDNEPGPISAAYTAGRPNLERRVLFTNARSRSRDAAFVRRNEPTGANLGEVRKRCQGGVVEPTAVPGRPPTTPALPG
jgi:hypothetical protein